MPIKSAKQFRAMEASAHSKSSIGIPSKVAKEFLNKTSHKKKSILAKQYSK